MEEVDRVTTRKVAQDLDKLSDLRADPIIEPPAASCSDMTVE